MITSITVLSYEAMRERVRERGIPDNAVVVSIIDPEEEPIFEQDTERTITLRFHDLDPRWPVNTDLDPKDVFMTERDARRIVDHVLTFHRDPARWALLVNCMAGVSRSGAVATFVQRYANIPERKFRKQNPGLHPNEHVLGLLVRELHNRGSSELDGRDNGDHPSRSARARRR
jgi:predicted protein tyrosine phosphatase